MNGPGHDAGAWRNAQTSSTCAHCGYALPASAARCPQCGRFPNDDDALTVLGDTPAPTPAVPPGTTFGNASENVTRFVAPSSVPDDVTRMVAPAEASENVTRFVAPSADSSADETRFVPADSSDDETRFETPEDALTVATPVTPPSHKPRPRRGSDTGPLEVGQSFGPRYHIIRMLGVGGMGAVYQAWDAELGVAVAIKVIRPEVMEDPVMAEEVSRRFKRELLLARQVTHKNVVRIHDIGDIDGIKYITMSYVEGTDLATILKRDGKRPVPELLHIARGVINGLVAAHTAGVVHRDLKPANIMIGKEGDPLIMDFGIAHSTGDPSAAPAPGAGVLPEHLRRAASHQAATTVGSIVGTVEYMAPEQAKGLPIDQRADVYAFGLILYDAFLGQRRAASGASAVEELQRRMASPPPPLQALVPDVPPPLAALIARCVEPEAEKRFQTSAEVATELERLDDQGHLIPIKKTIGLPLMAAIVTLLLAVIGGTWWYWQRLVPAPTHDPVRVAIADFVNSTGDPTFDHLIEPIIRRGLEDASFISAFDRTRLRAALGVQPPPTFDEQSAHLLAVNHGLDVVLAGSVARQGTAYTVSVKLTGAAKGEVIREASRRASNKDRVLDETARLITAVRTALGDTTSDEKQLSAMRTMTATRLDVARAYAAAFEAQSDGKPEETIKHLQEAIALDPKTSGLGYQGLAIISRNLDKIDEAKTYIQQALGHLDGMTMREQLATRGVNSIIQGSPERCVQEYGVLLREYAADAIAHNQRALCLSKMRNLRDAVAEMRKAVQLLPKRVMFRGNLAAYSAYGGDFETAEKEARAVDEPYDYAVLTLAFAQLGKGLVPEATQTYERMAGMGAQGASRSIAGLGDLAIYQGRYTDAVRILEEGAKADLSAKFPERAARKFINVGYAHLSRQETKRAIAVADQALRTSSSVEVQFLAARILVEGGQIERARKLATALAKQVPTEPHTYGRILEGEIALKSGDARAAIAILTEANDPQKGGLDTWLGHFDLGRAYLALDQYADADSHFDQCILRKGEALSLLLDEVPTFGHLPIVYYYRGQTREALKSAGFANSYQEYLKIRGNSTEDPLIPIIRRRVGTRP